MLLHNTLSTKDIKITLASQSPRRQQLLADAGLEFETLKYEVEESYPDTLPAEEVPLYLAKLKSENYPRPLAQNEIVITADTVVISREEILGKPKDEEGAREMLRRLSSEEHQVTTGVYIRTATNSIGFSAHTKVWFRELNEEEICYYVEKFSPTDKAGSYGIQEWIGYIGVERIEGSFYNVMGLPIQHLYSELKKLVSTL